MFLKLHEDKKSWTWRSNTCLVLTNILKFGFEFDDLEKVSLTFVVLEKGSKYIKQLAAKFIKTESQITYLENIGLDICGVCGCSRKWKSQTV